MKGLYGAMLIALGIFVSIMGGYLLNAETVTVCETDWEYVTDIGGAFRGSGADMEVQYDPKENVTGWAAYNDPNGNAGIVTGVYYEYFTAESGKANLFRIDLGDGSDTEYTVDFTATDDSGQPPYAGAGYTVQTQGAASVSGTMPTGFGQYNREVATVFVDGGRSHWGAFAVPLSTLATAIPDFRDLTQMVITVDNPVSGYPCFATVRQSNANGTITHGGAEHNGVIVTQTALTSSTSLYVYPQGMSAAVGSASVPLSQIYLVFGQAKFNSMGSSSASASVSVSAMTEGTPAYMDPAAGVTPDTGTYTVREATWVYHASSMFPEFSADFVHDDTAEDAGATGVLGYTAEGDGETVIAFEYEIYTNVRTFTAMVTPSGGQPVNLTGSGIPSITASLESGRLHCYVGGQHAGVIDFNDIDYELDGFYFTVRLGSHMKGCTAVATNDAGVSSAQSTSSGATFYFPLGYTRYQTTEREEPYSGAWWRNGQQNSSITVAFAMPSGASYPASENLIFYGENGTQVGAIEVDAGLSGWNAAEDDIGSWPAVELTVSTGGTYARPISAFRSFSDYDVVDKPMRITDGLSAPATHMRAYATEMRIAVVSTVAHIPEGGLFLQDASMDLSSSFPDAYAVSVMIGSAAAYGDGITFSAYANSVTLPVDPDAEKIRLDGEWYPFDAITFRWYSPAADSVTAGGTTYSPAIYSRGKTYDSGAIWAEPKGKDMIRVLDVGSVWTMTLDGVWAPAIFMYEGENKAAERTELADIGHPEFGWDKSQFLLILLGVCAAGGVVGSYLGKTDMMDWAVIAVSAAVIWMLLG